MKKIFLPFLFAVSAVTVISSCKKETVTPPPPVKPSAEFHVFSPKADDSYNTGDTIFLHLDVKADVTLHGYDVYIITTPGADTLFATDGHAHSKLLSIDTFWVNTLTSPEKAIIRVEAPLDHDGNVGIKEIPVWLNKP